MPPPPGDARSYESWEHVAAAPPAEARRRPAGVTVAGVMLIVAGGFAGLAALVIALTGDGATVEGVGGGGSGAVAVIALVMAGIEVASGVLVLRLAPVGRVLGVVASVVGIVGGLAAITTAQGALTVGVFVAVLYVLLTNAAAFRRTADR